jgi:hypothetical protein
LAGIILVLVATHMTSTLGAVKMCAHIFWSGKMLEKTHIRVIPPVDRCEILQNALNINHVCDALLLCVCEREREREKDKEREREREREREKERKRERVKERER